MSMSLRGYQGDYDVMKPTIKSLSDEEVLSHGTSRMCFLREECPMVCR